MNHWSKIRTAYRKAESFRQAVRDHLDPLMHTRPEP